MCSIDESALKIYQLKNTRYSYRHAANDLCLSCIDRQDIAQENSKNDGADEVAAIFVNLYIMQINELHAVLFARFHSPSDCLSQIRRP